MRVTVGSTILAVARAVARATAAKCLSPGRRAISFAAASAALIVTADARAVDYTDLWFNPAEPGWGISVTQQGDTVFALWFVYGGDSSTAWYVMSNGVRSGDVFSGELYETSGPPLSATFDPARVSLTNVGTAKLDFSASSGQAVVTYTVRGTTYVKNVQRQSFKVSSLPTHVAMSVRMSRAGCTYAPNNEARTFLFSLERPSFTGQPITSISVSTSNTVTITQGELFILGSGLLGTGQECVATGVLTGRGRYAAITGTYDCGRTGRKGTFQIEDLMVDAVTTPVITPLVQSTHRIMTLSGRIATQDTAGETCKSAGVFSATSL